MCDCSDSGRRDRRRCTSASWCSAAVGFRFFMPANILIIHETAKGLGEKIYIKTQDLDAKGMETSEDLRTLVHHYNLRRGAEGRAISPDHRKKDWVTHVCFQPQPLPRLVQSHFSKSDFGAKTAFGKVILRLSVVRLNLTPGCAKCVLKCQDAQIMGLAMSTSNRRKGN